MTELTNVWRRRAVRVLADESLAGSARGLEPAARVRRFYATESEWLRQCVQQCREPLGCAGLPGCAYEALLNFDCRSSLCSCTHPSHRHPLPEELAVQRSFGSKLRELVDANTQFVSGSVDSAIIDNVLSQVRQPSLFGILALHQHLVLRTRVLFFSTHAWLTLSDRWSKWRAR
jgi:hypothetical protein